MTVGDLFSSGAFGMVVTVSLAGSLVACRGLWSRVWFFLLAPPLYMMLWVTLGAILILVPGLSSMTHVIVTTFVTLALYTLTCVILHNDGPRGIALVGGLGGRGGKRGGRGEGGTAPPSPITYKRFQLK